MMRLATLLPVWAITITMLALALDVVSRRWRRHDGALWHQVWVAFVLTTAAAAVVSSVSDSPALLISIPLPSTRASLWAATNSGSSGWRAVAPYLVAGTAAIAALCMIRLFAGWMRVRRLGRLAQPAFGPDAERFVAAATRGANLSLAQFRVHRRVRTPMTVGWKHPLIVLPSSWTTWPVERLGVIVRHELAHVERRDYFWNLIVAAVEAGMWFVPGIWLASRRVRLCAELAADQMASERVGRVVYARHLVDTAADIGRRGRLAEFSLALGVTTDLQRRVESLLDEHARPPSATRHARVAVAVLAAVLVLAAMAVRAAPAPSAEPSADHTQLHAIKHQH